MFFFPLLAGSVLYWAGLHWVGSGFCCQFPEHKDPFFSCQSQPDVPRLVLNSDPSLSLAFSSKRVIRVAAHTHTHTPNLVEHTYSEAQTEIHTHSVTGMHTNTAWLRRCNHRGPKGIPEQEWAPITCFSTLERSSHSPIPPGHVV